MTALVTSFFLFEAVYTASMLELHLLDIGFTEKESAYLYGFMCFFYLVSSLVIGNLKTDKRLLLSLGLFVYFLAFVLVGPIIFSFKYVTIASLPLFGIGAGLCSGMRYTVPAVPQMVDFASNYYNYPADDRLTDALSSINMTFYTIGEVLGPISGGLLIVYFRYEEVSAAIGFVFLAYSLFYSISSDYILDLCCRKTCVEDLTLSLV